MSAVDVMAVLDDLAAGIHIGQHEAARVRAAVAELIDAAEAMARVQVNRQTTRNDAGSAKKARLRAAIAKATGSQP